MTEEQDSRAGFTGFFKMGGILIAGWELSESGFTGFKDWQDWRHARD